MHSAKHLQICRYSLKILNSQIDSFSFASLLLLATYCAPYCSYVAAYGMTCVCIINRPTSIMLENLLKCFPKISPIFLLYIMLDYPNSS